MASNSEWLARKLLELEQQVQALGRGTRLGHSSLQGGSILALDEDGKALAELGTDGVVHLDGPEPPRPTAPVLEQGVGTIFVRWDGDWDPLVEGDDGELPTTPLDFDRIEVHATTDPEATEWDEDTLAGSITQRNGGVVMIRGWDIDDVVYVRLVCRSLADKLSEPSERAEVTVTGIDIAAIVDELDAANVELANLDGTMFAANAELDALRIQFKNLDTSIINTDDGTLAEALADARQALEDLNAGQSQLREDLDAVEENARGGTNHYRPAPPEGTDHTENDLWFDTSVDPETGLTAYMPHRWDEAAQDWVSVGDQRTAAIQDAQDDLAAEVATVRTSVDGKNAITQSIDAPPSQYDGAVGDRWERMSSMGSGGSLISNWRWNGDVWVSTIISDAVLGNVDAAKIGTGYLDAARIKAGTIAADRLVVGISQNLVVDSKFKNAEINAARANNGSPNTWDVVESGAETWFRSKPGVSITSRFFYLTTDGVSTNPVTRISVDPTSVWHMSVEVNISSSAQAITHLAASCVAYSADGTARFLTKDFTRSDTGGRRIDPGEGWVRLEATYDWSDYDGVVTVAPRVYVVSGGGGPDGWTWFRNPFVGEKTGSTLIEDGAITTDKIAVGAITAESGIIGSLDAGVITVGEMNGARIEADSITAREIAADAIGARAIAADAIEAGKIAADAITGREIAANAIKAEQIVGLSITADELAANSISTSKIVASAIIADKIAANAVTTAKLDALAVTADKVAANAITADKIAANAITAGKIDSDAINGMVITGATVRTNASGARVEMNAEGLVQYNAQGQPIVDMTGGTFSTVGSLQTGRPGDRRVIISNEVWNNPGTGIVFVPEDGEVAPAHASRIGTPYRKWLEIAVEEDWTSSGYRSRARFRDLYLELTHSQLEGTVEDGPFSQLKLGTVIGQTQDPAQWFLGGGTRIPNSSSAWASHVGGTLEGVSLVSQEGFAWIKGGGNVQVESGSGGMSLNTSGTMTLAAATQFTWNTTRIQWDGVPTASGGTALTILANGRIGKSSSSRRYKVAEEPLAATDGGFFDRLLSIEPKTWYDRDEVEYFADVIVSRQRGVGIDPDWVNAGPIRRQVGAVAEDLHDAGLGALVSYTAEGEPESIMYERIGVALIPIIKGMREQIDRLEAANGIGG